MVEGHKHSPVKSHTENSAVMSMVLAIDQTLNTMYVPHLNILEKNAYIKTGKHYINVLGQGNSIFTALEILQLSIYLAIKPAYNDVAMYLFERLWSRGRTMQSYFDWQQGCLLICSKVNVCSKPQNIIFKIILAELIHSAKVLNTLYWIACWEQQTL